MLHAAYLYLDLLIVDKLAPLGFKREIHIIHVYIMYLVIYRIRHDIISNGIAPDSRHCLTAAYINNGRRARIDRGEYIFIRSGVIGNDIESAF